MTSLFLIHRGEIGFLREYIEDIKKKQRLQLSAESMLTNEMTACFSDYRARSTDVPQNSDVLLCGQGPNESMYPYHSYVFVCRLYTYGYGYVNKLDGQTESSARYNLYVHVRRSKPKVSELRQ